MSPGLPLAVLPRIGALLRLLGSDQDHEALGAVRALRRTLSGAGVDLHALADLVEHPLAPAVERPDPAPQARRDRKTRAANPGSVILEPARRRQVIEALSKASARGDLSAWEDEFAGSVITILRSTRPRLSARQFEIVERIVAKVGERRAWA